MSVVQLLVFTVVVVTVQTADLKQRLQVPPPPMEGFNLNAYLGQWFVQFRKAPCSWPGSSSFTDYVQNVMPDGAGGLLNQLTWRSRGICNTVTGRYQIVGPGVFNNIDTIGDSLSGRVIVAATDYKTFVIYWGCTKMVATGETCEDPWISVKTRLRFPPPLVISRIENILRARWGISVGELQKVPQQMPCPRNISKKCR